MTILIFLAVLVLLILVHEFGHFIVAKKSGIRVDEFGIGFPPKVWGKKYGETEYTINWLPLGGFVKIYGEDPTQEHYEGPENARSFVTKPRYIQAAVLVAGVAMNLFLAYVLFVITFMAGMPNAFSEDDPTLQYGDAHVLVSSTMQDTPAYGVLEPKDELLRLTAGERALEISETKSISDVIAFIGASGENELTFELMRQNTRETVSLTPAAGVIAEEPERVAAGFTMMIGIDPMSFTNAIPAAALFTWSALKETVVGLSTLLSQSIRGDADLSQISGPVGIVGLVGDAAAMGFVWLLILTAFISLNLAVINLLPIPALDGGRLVFVLIGAITRRPIKPIIATRVNQIGFIALLTLMAIVTVSDILKFF